uniref:Ras-associating domain-containing protein n=1 Tax=Heterorhabditis bacteriophora TaxID=37862 RepID=A0A1I7X5U7_HETBA
MIANDMLTKRHSISQQYVLDAALRRFHITDNPDNYYVTQVVSDAGEEEALEDPVPLRNVKRPEGRRAQIFLRYKDDPDKDVVRLYGGWLRTISKLRIPVTFCSLTVTKDTLVQDAIAEALENFGLDGTTWNRYNLIEVSLDRGVAERTCNPQENMLQLDTMNNPEDQTSMIIMNNYFGIGIDADIRITTHEEWPVQVDGEPHIQPPGTITILKSALKAQMLRKPLRSRHGRLTRECNKPRTGHAPLAMPEDDGRSRFVLGKQIGRRLGKSLGRFERRHSLGREKGKIRELGKEHHSVTDYCELSSTSNEI